MFIESLIHFAASTGILYAVNLEPALAIPIAWFITLLICVLLREFTHGWLRYVLAVLFIVSFGALWYILMLDYSPYQFVIPGVVLFGGVCGLWSWARDVLKDLEKL